MLSSTQIGKSFFASEWLLERAWTQPSRVHPWWWTAPTYGQAMIGLRYVVAFSLSAGILAGSEVRTEGVKGVRITYPVVTLINGGFMEFRSWERPENLMGNPIKGGVADEAGLLDTDSHGAISSRRSGTMGPLLYLGNPGVQNGPFRRLCAMAERARDPQSEYAGRYSMHKWTWRDKAELLRRLTPAQRAQFALPTALEYEQFINDERTAIKPEEEFRRLYEAEWTVDESAVFRFVPEDGAPLDAAEDGHEYVTGVDVGQLNDYLVAMTACRQCRRLVAMERWRGIPYPQSAERLEATAARWNKSPLVIEINGPGLGLYQELQRRGKTHLVPFTTTGLSKQEIIMSLAVQLERPDARLQVAEMTPVQSELSEYRYQRMPGGSFRYGAPAGGHDDTVIAAALANYGLIHVPSIDLSQYGWA